MEPGTVFMILGFWIVIIVTVGVLIIRRIRRETRAALDRARPEYEYGTAISDWELACQKSYDWSHSRRNGNSKTKEEVKSR